LQRTVDGQLSAPGKGWRLVPRGAHAYPLDMPNANKPKRCSFALRPHELALWVVRPIARQLMLHHRIGIAQGKQLSEQLQEMQRAMELMSQELGRLSQRKE